MNYLNCKNISTAIRRAKTLLIKHAKAKGLYENFGQKEVREIEDKFIHSSDYYAQMNLNRSKLKSFVNWCVNFDISKKMIHIGLTCLFLALFTIFDWIGLLRFHLANSVVILYTIGLLVYVVRSKRVGSFIASAGYLIGVIPVSVLYFGFEKFPLIDPYRYEGFTLINMGAYIIFLFSLIFSVGRQLGEQDRQHKEAQLRSQRLEIELLKKSIQPHFIMNTLNSLKSLWKDKPEAAEKLIHAIADEFRIIKQIASCKEIPIEKEIQLCKIHLELMGYRRDAKYRLITENLIEDQTVPPLIFHTLIENGLSHAYPPMEDGTFRLIVGIEDGSFCYRLQNDGSLLKELSAYSVDEIEEGMGLNYVKVRLEENYPGNWSITYGMENEFWEVKIIIRKRETV